VERRYVGIDLHRRRSVIYTMTGEGEKVSCVRIANDPVALSLAVAEAGDDAEVVIEATYGWYWAVDMLQADGHRVHLAHPSGNDWGNRRVKNDERDARDLADLLRLGRLAEAWIAPPATRELRELVRYRAKLVALRSGLKAQVHAVMAKEGVLPRVLENRSTAWLPPRVTDTVARSADGCDDPMQRRREHGARKRGLRERRREPS
jgi:transposase